MVQKICNSYEVRHQSVFDVGRNWTSDRPRHQLVFGVGENWTSDLLFNYQRLY